MSLSADHETLTLDDSNGITVTATAKDSSGAAVDSALTFTTTPSDALQGGALKVSPGVYRAVVRASAPGPVTVTASMADGKATGATTVTFTPGAPANLRFDVQPKNGKAGAVLAPVTLSVLDKNGNVSPGAVSVSVRLVYSSSGVVSGGAATPAVNGSVTFDMLSVNRPQQGYALRAETVDGLAMESTKFDIAVGDASASTSTLTASPLSLPVGSASTLTLALKDVAGNAIAQAPVMLSVDGGGVLAATTGMTDATGGFATTLSSAAAGQRTVTCLVGGLTLTVTVNFQ